MFPKEIRPNYIAYFSMEVGLDSSMPTYSGGLGVIAGDTLRAAADLSILGRVITAVMAACLLPPPVVDHHLIPARRLVVQPGEELGAAPQLAGMLPLPVREDQ